MSVRRIQTLYCVRLDGNSNLLLASPESLQGNFRAVSEHTRGTATFEPYAKAMTRRSNIENSRRRRSRFRQLIAAHLLFE